MFKNKACEILKIKELTFVNDCFEYERNEVIGHYRQTLIKHFPFLYVNLKMNFFAPGGKVLLQENAGMSGK